MRKISIAAIAAMSMLVLAAPEMMAQFNYGFNISSGERIGEEFNELQNGSRAGACQTQRGNPPSDDGIKIGFIFRFDNVDYEEVTVNSNGFLAFRDRVDDPGNNSLENLSTPILAPFWDVMRLPGGENNCNRPGIIQYALVGEEPSRILVVDYYDPALGDGCTDRVYAPVQFQVRLYEGSNKIEFYYEDMNPVPPDCFGGTPATTSASIGIGSENGFISIVPQNGSEAVASTVNDEGSVDLQENGINRGIVYGFCPASVVGNPDEGGTPGMQDGDVLLQGVGLIVYNSRTFQPFTLYSYCASNFSYSITGPSADEYSIDPTEGELHPEKGNMPTITFRPTGTGIREATLTIRDDLGFVARSYTLVGEGNSRVTYVGNIDQGGTPELNDGDILMQNIKVRNGSSGDFTPISIEIMPSDQPGAPDAPVTYTLIDPTGQFSIDRTSEDVPPGGVSTPVITFSPNNNIDVQSATLIVNAEGEERRFVLRPFASGPGARFTVNGGSFINGSAVMRGVFGCVGEARFTTTFEIAAIGDEPFVIESLDAFQVNPDVTQGTPPSPILLDPFGEPLKMGDYFIADAPDANTPLEFPIVINPGETRTMYLTFVPTRPGKRAARTFFRTNGENFFGVEVDRQSTRGMLNMEMVGQGIGAVLNNQAGTGLPKPILFPSTDVRGSSRAVGYVRNSGECDLRIKREAFRLVSGDINEFSIVSAFVNSIDPTTGDYVIPPGAVDSIVVGFTPIRSGSRRASLRLATNDSLVIIGGVVARGEYYIDLFGVGNVGLEARTLVLPPAVINGASSSGKTMLENTSAELLQITNIRILNGGTEIIEDPANPWPVLPLTITPGQKIPLGLVLIPDPAIGPGTRTATVEVTLSNGNVLTIDVRGIAGTRTLNVAPTTLFQGVRVPVGEVRRAFALITNNGTFPVTIQSYQLTGPNKDDYAVGNITRGVVEPGETLPIDVVYTPSIQGVSNAALEFTTSSTNGTPAGTHIVVLGGEGTSTALEGDPQGSTIASPTAGEELGRTDALENNVASVARLYEVVPNPVSNTATFRFTLPAEGDVLLGLYDMEGRLVKNVAAGLRKSGEHVVRVDLDNLPSGSYYVRLGFGGSVMTRVINLVK